MHYGNVWLCTGLLLLAVGQLTEAATSLVSYHDDAHPGKCTASETDILSPGETTITSKFCAKITCENEDGLAQIAGCIPQAPLGGCRWGPPLNKTRNVVNASRFALRKDNDIKLIFGYSNVKFI